MKKLLYFLLIGLAMAVFCSQAFAQPSRTGKSKKGIQAFDSLMKKAAEVDSGLFNFYRIEEKFYFEIPEELLGREILIVTRNSGTVDGLTFGGAGMKTRPQQVIRWERLRDKLLLRSVSFQNVASEDLPIYKSLRNNNYEPIIMAFDIAALGRDSSSVIVEVSGLFTTDVPLLGALNPGQRKRFKVKGLDSKRTFIQHIRAYPENVEVRHVVTYKADELPSRSSSGTLSLEMNQSMILLPEDPMMPRMYDERVGYFSISQYDYGLDEQKAAQRRYITRWRLEPKDPEAFARGELVEPVKPIVYYVDPGTPDKWRPYIKQGVEDWQAAFEEAGFKNAIIAKDPPSPEEDPEWSPEDVRYSVVRYITTPIQNAQGPHVHDPRTGEILESDILWYHNVMNLLRNWYFIQTAAVNPAARAPKFSDEVMGECIRFVAAHEVGHTLGLPHNFGSSYAYPVDSLRSPRFTQAMGTAPSIMDYARFNYVAQPGDEGVSLMPGIGIYDKYSIRWGYRPIPEAKSSEEEKATLHAWITEHTDDPLYFYGRQTRIPMDPRSQSEALGDDAVLASNYGINNLKLILDNLIDWTTESGQDYEDLEELYGQILGQWNRYMGHVTAYVGGVYETPKTADQEGVVYEHVSAADQRRAMDFLTRELFQTPTWLIDTDVLSRIEPEGMLDRIKSYQTRTLNRLLAGDRVGRIMENEALNGSSAYSMDELMEGLRVGIFTEALTGKASDPYRRNLQRAYLIKLTSFVKSSESEVAALARMELDELDGILKKAGKSISDDRSKAHYADLRSLISISLDDD